MNPDAPKGGEIVLQVSSTSGNQNFTTFNTLNTYILKGDGAAGMGLTFDSLMSGSGDEPDSLYGLVARAVRISADKTSYRFLLRKEARFHDGSPLTAHDVAFSFNILKTKGHPSIRQSLRDLEAAEAEADDVVMVRLKPRHSREAALIVAGQPVFSAAYYAGHPFDETTLEPPLGSSAYKVGPFDSGHYIAFDRVRIYRARILRSISARRISIASGSNISVTAKSPSRLSRRASSLFARNSPRPYGRPAMIAPPSGMAGSYARRCPMNRQWGRGLVLEHKARQVEDARIRQAIGLAFDFEWTCRCRAWRLIRAPIVLPEALPMAAAERSGAGRSYAARTVRGDLDPAVFGEVYVPPVSDGSGQDRGLLRRAATLFSDAGCKRQGAALDVARRQAVRDRVSGFRRRAGAAHRAVH